MRTVLPVLVSIILLSIAEPSLAQPVTNTASPQSTVPSQQQASSVLAPVHDCLQFYPAISVRLNQQGTVGLVVNVSPEGTVTNVRVVQSSGFDALDAASILCARQWKYRPAMQNGKPIAAQTQARVTYALGGRFAASAMINREQFWVPPPPPQGWSPDVSSEGQGGVIAAYEFSGPIPATDQFLSAGAYSGLSTLDDFITPHDGEFRSVATPGSLREQKITVCDGVPAWEAEYSRAGLIASNPDQVLTIRQVVAVTNGSAYVATYIRPAGAPVRSDADQWIHSYCKSNS